MRRCFLFYAKNYSFAKHFYRLSVIQLMKKGISIAMVLLMLTAMLNISVATHYCGGKLIASKVSINGKLANCGMEGSEKKIPLSGTNFASHCCDDIVTSCRINSNYTPSFSFIPDSYQFNFHIFSAPTGASGHSLAVLRSLYTSTRPPGTLMSTNVDLSDICVFRV
jgi:hypothetical protein